MIILPTKMKTNDLSESERLKIKLAFAHLYYYRNLIKYGTNLFEEDGTIILKINKSRKEIKHEGRKLITDTLNYFADKDNSYFYMKCARLKKVLDDYDIRYSNIRHEELKTYE